MMSGRGCIIGFLCCGLVLAAAEKNLLYNGNLKHGLTGFRTVMTQNPAGQIGTTMQILQKTSSKSILRMNLSSDTARSGIIVQPLSLAEVKAAGKIALSCRLRIQPQGLDDFEGGVFLRLRQRKEGQVRNLCGLWLPFSRKDGLHGTLYRYPEMGVPVNEKPLKGRWHDIKGVGMLDDAADGVDFMLVGNAKSGAVRVEITDLALRKVIDAPCKLMKRPFSVMSGQKFLPVRLQINQTVDVVYSLRQKGKKVSQGGKRLEPGEQVLFVNLQRLKAGDFELELNAGDWTECLQIQVEEDPFAD